MTTENLCFQLLKLPVVPRNHVLKLFTPVELISLSLTSRHTKSICKTIRGVYQCKKGMETFDVRLNSNRDIRMSFKYFPKCEWVFHFEKEPNRKGLIELGLDRIPSFETLKQWFSRIWHMFRGKRVNDQKTGSMGKSLEGLKFLSWIPVEKTASYGRGAIDSSPFKRHTMTIYSSDNVILPIHKLVLYISDLFNIELTSLGLNYTKFNADENRMIMSLFVLSQKNLKLFQLTGITPTDPSKNDILIQILKNQNTVNTRLLFNPSPKFFFDFNICCQSFKVMDIDYSHWISFKQILEMKTELLYLSRTTLLENDFKVIVQKWRNGWTPHWKIAMIELNEVLNIDSCAEGEDFFQLENQHFVHKDVIRRNWPIELNKFEQPLITTWGTIIRTGYHILRADGMIASIGVESDRVGWIHIQSPKHTRISLSNHLRSYEILWNM
ncbi:hypothetical protein CRE_18192 [Caenorhabditis remanei]|uniref:F-box domain-containing protein n=1 Tax=Caenorhabditis remanei TaxID=31234 RepID=E3NCH6_CAERE|nr:hypothetical protein CRE_18192 [Caenorhabditis remanei]